MGDEDEFWGPKSIVIDNGSFNIKAGFNGDEIPKISLRNVIGENKDDDG
jgi:actin-related protein